MNQKHQQKALPKGTRIADYEIIDKVGSGASGTVYKAQRANQTGTPLLALKILHPHLLREPQLHRRFLREARILAELDHPKVVKLRDFGEVGQETLYMALDFVEGDALDDLCQKRDFSVDEALLITQQVCEALVYAHEKGVIHRDLKPGNVMLQGGRAEGYQIQVLDFGMAKALRGDMGDSVSTLTEQNMIFGTPEYMSPEQARGEEVDFRADIYATGILLYELLCGRVPFDEPTPLGTMTAHLAMDPPPPSRHSKRTIPPAADAVALHALAKDPNDRYPSAQAMSLALEHAAKVPHDTKSVVPPQSRRNHDAHSDTELALPFAETTRHKAVGPFQNDPPVKKETASWWWIVVAGALVGIVVGVLLSLTEG